MGVMEPDPQLYIFFSFKNMIICNMRVNELNPSLRTCSKAKKSIRHASILNVSFIKKNMPTTILEDQVSKVSTIVSISFQIHCNNFFWFKYIR